jgi:hypothetical protein
MRHAVCFAILCALAAVAAPAAPARADFAADSVALPPRTPLALRYAGTIDYEGHYRRPGETRRFESEQRYYTDGLGRARLDWATWAKGDTARAPESFLVIGTGVYHRDSPSSPWRSLEGVRARLARFQVEAGFRTRDRIEARAHPRYGDVRDSVVFRPRPGADTMLVVLHELGSRWRLEQRLAESSDVPFPESLLANPTSPLPAKPDPEALGTEPVIVPLAPGVYRADMEDLDSRSLIVEFADHLAVAEFAESSRNGERLVDALARRWPAKPIRFALFTHHHPHYTGGLRALIAAGATIVTTPGNEAFVREIAARSFRLDPDRLAREPRPPSIRTFSDRIELADSSNRLVAIDYGERSEHTDEMVVFWVPRAKLLFETELGWFWRDGVLRASSRAGPLLDWIAEQGLDVDRLVQGWPMRGNEWEVARERLARLVVEGRR